MQHPARSFCNEWHSIVCSLLVLYLSANIGLGTFCTAPVSAAPSQDSASEKEAAVLNNEGVRLLTAGDFPGAIEKLEKAVRIAPNYKLGITNLAIAHNNYGLSLRNSPKESIKEFRMSCFLDEQNATSRNNLNSAIKLSGKDPSSFDVRVDMANKANSQSDFVAAAVEFQEALKLRDDPATHEELAAVYCALNMTNRANREHNLAQASRTGPQYSQLSKLGAATNTSRRESPQPQNTAAELAEAGLLKHRQKDFTAAIAYYGKALLIAPMSAPVWFNLGSAYQSTNKFSNARDAYERALLIDAKGQIETLLLIATIDERLGNSELALSEYRDYSRRAGAKNPALAQLKAAELAKTIERGQASKPEPILTQQRAEQVDQHFALNAIPDATSSTAHPGSEQFRNGTKYGASRAIRDKWALIIGISKFKNPRYNLHYAAKDAQDFRNFLVNENSFAPDHVKLLTDEQATRDNIMDAFGEDYLPRVTRPGDLVVIYISTHGTPADRDEGGESYIVAWDTDKDRLFRSGINMKLLEERINKAVHTNRALIVMDTCFSGAAAMGAKGDQPGANFKASDIAQGTGHLVVCSSDCDQRSWESKNYQNGVFTHFLIQALRRNGGRTEFNSAFDYMQEQVEWEVQRDYGFRQVPQKGGHWEGGDLVLSTPPSEHRSLGASNGGLASVAHRGH